MWISHRKEIRKLTFRAQALRRSESINLRVLCCLNEKQTKILSTSILVGTYHSGRSPFRQFNSGNFSSGVNGLNVSFYCKTLGKYGFLRARLLNGFVYFFFWKSFLVKKTKKKSLICHLPPNRNYLKPSVSIKAQVWNPSYLWGLFLFVCLFFLFSGNDNLANFCRTLEETCIDTIEAGHMTKDLAGCIKGIVQCTAIGLSQYLWIPW